MKEIYNNNKSFYQKSILKLLFPEDITLMDFINPKDSKYLYNSKNSYVSGDVCFINSDNPTWYKCKSDTSGIFDSSKWSKVCTTDLSGAINEAKDYFDQKLNELIGNAPEALDTLNELAAALGNDANFSTTILNKIAEKADGDHTHTKNQITDFPTSLPANGGNADTVGGKSASSFALNSHTHTEFNSLLIGGEEHVSINSDGIQSDSGVHDITGFNKIEADEFIGSGSNLTNVNADMVGGKHASDFVEKGSNILISAISGNERTNTEITSENITLKYNNNMDYVNEILITPSKIKAIADAEDGFSIVESEISGFNKISADKFIGEGSQIRNVDAIKFDGKSVDDFLQKNGGIMSEDAFITFNGSTAINTGLKLLTSNSINSAKLYPGELYIEKSDMGCIRYSYDTITGKELLKDDMYCDFSLNYQGISFSFNEESAGYYSTLTNKELIIGNNSDLTDVSITDSHITVYGNIVGKTIIGPGYIKGLGKTRYDQSFLYGWRIDFKEKSEYELELEIAVTNNGNEPIVVRQYNGSTGAGMSGFETINRELTLLDSNGDSQFPGYITIKGLKGAGGNLSYYRGTTESYILDSINSNNFGVPFVWTGSVDSDGKPVGLHAGQTCMILES